MPKKDKKCIFCNKNDKYENRIKKCQECKAWCHWRELTGRFDITKSETTEIRNVCPNCKQLDKFVKASDEYYKSK